MRRVKGTQSEYCQYKADKIRIQQKKYSHIAATGKMCIIVGRSPLYTQDCCIHYSHSTTIHMRGLSVCHIVIIIINNVARVAMCFTLYAELACHTVAIL